MVLNGYASGKWMTKIVPILLTALLTPTAGAQERKALPLRGVVNSPSHPGLMVRRHTPEVSAFSYHLADPVCGVGNGSEFIALEDAYLANGEVWFRVYFVKVSKKIDPCSQEQPNGWMVARSKDRWLVSVLAQDIPLSSSVNTAITAQAPRTGTLAGQEQSSSYTFSLKYVLLVLGTVLAVCIVAIERSGEVHPRRWCSRFVVFEFLVLSAINILTVALFIEEFFKVDSPDLLFRLLKVVQGSPGGYALLGFLLSIVLIKFLSFAKSRPE